MIQVYIQVVERPIQNVNNALIFTPTPYGDFTLKVQERLRMNEVKCVVMTPDREEFDNSEFLTPDIVISVGGDGTLLRAANLALTYDIPVLGINAGNLGFLTAFEGEHIDDAVKKLVLGELTCTPRQRLRVTLKSKDWGGNSRVIGDVFNDVVVKHGQNPRLIDLQIRNADMEMVRYRADGVIVATPSGSTAYNLACRGPVLVPGSKVFVVTPIVPHSLTSLPIVVPEEGPLEIEFMGSKESEAYVTCDGILGPRLTVGDIVIVQNSEKMSWIVQTNHNVFKALNQKFGWTQN